MGGGGGGGQLLVTMFLSVCQLSIMSIVFLVFSIVGAPIINSARCSSRHHWFSLPPPSSPLLITAPPSLPHPLVCPSSRWLAVEERGGGLGGPRRLREAPPPEARVRVVDYLHVPRRREG